MSVLFDTPLIVGKVLFTTAPFGIAASSINNGGEDGPAYIYDQITLLGLTAELVRGEVVTWPATGTLRVYEDTSFVYTPSGDGASFFEYQLYVDGVATGTVQRVDLSTGVVPALSAAAATLITSSAVTPQVTVTF